MGDESVKYFMGLDPGEKGGIAIVDDCKLVVALEKIPDSAEALLQLIRSLLRSYPVERTYIERIDPRPTYFKKGGKWTSSILRSTCILYGDFLQLHMAVLSTGTPIQTIGPAQWQRGLDIPKKGKKTKAEHKRLLKEKAKELFPKVKGITLATCDALLIAEYCRRICCA